MKERVGKEIAALVRDGDVIGVGTGSTVDAALEVLKGRIKDENLSFSVVTTSYQSAWRCSEIGITVLDSGYRGAIAWGFDGADAVDTQLRAVKGKGAAMLEEKIVAARCNKYYLIVDDSKCAEDICARCAVPVEVIPSARLVVEDRVRALGAAEVSLRDAAPGKHGPVITERGNIILDARFPSFRPGLEHEIKSIVGVVENGLFERYADEVWIARPEGVERLTRPRS